MPIAPLVPLETLLTAVRISLIVVVIIVAMALVPFAVGTIRRSDFATAIARGPARQG